MQETIENNSLNQSVSNSVSASTVVTANDQQPKTNSFLVILLSVLLFISVSIAGFFAYQTQKLVKELNMLKTEISTVANIEPIVPTDPTADWKTYTNKKHNFSFRYPSKWTLNKLWEDSESNASVNIENGPALIQIYANDISNENPRNWTGVPVDVSGLKLFKTDIDINSDDNKLVFIVDKLNQSTGGFTYLDRKYSIVLKYSSKDLSDIDISSINTEFDQILSTFKFTNSDPTVNWKTYTNNEFGFQMKYPSVWKLEVDQSVVTNGNREFRFKSEKNEYINGVVFDGPTGYIQKLEDWEKKINMSNGDSLFVSYTDNLGPGSKGGIKDIELFKLFISTFKIVD